MVIHHHVYPLSGRTAPSFFFADYGALGVGIFFVISGYLVSGSLARSASLGDYLKKRLLRIEPGLIAALLVTALVLGATLTTLPLAQYLTSPDVWLYVAKNALLYPVDYTLPGVFAANPFPAVVNGSLWTLRLEFSCYLALAALAAVKLLRPRVVTVLALAAAAGLVCLHLIWPPEAGWLRLADVAVLNGFLFLAGVWLHLHGKAPPWWAIAASLLLLTTPLWALGLPAVVLGVGFLPAPKLPADLSYGLYIYAFPLQQVLACQWRAVALDIDGGGPAVRRRLLVPDREAGAAVQAAKPSPSSVGSGPAMTMEIQASGRLETACAKPT